MFPGCQVDFTQWKLDFTSLRAIILASPTPDLGGRPPPVARPAELPSDNEIRVDLEFGPDVGTPKRIKQYSQAFPPGELHRGNEVRVSRHQDDRRHQPLESQRSDVETDSHVDPLLPDFRSDVLGDDRLLGSRKHCFYGGVPKLPALVGERTSTNRDIGCVLDLDNQLRIASEGLALSNRRPSVFFTNSPSRSTATRSTKTPPEKNRPLHHVGPRPAWIMDVA